MHIYTRARTYMGSKGLQSYEKTLVKATLKLQN